MTAGLTLNKITGQKGITIAEAASRVADLGWTPSYVQEAMTFPTDYKISKTPRDPMKQVLRSYFPMQEEKDNRVYGALDAALQAQNVVSPAGIVQTGDEKLMLLLERLQTRSRPFQFGLRSGSGISLRNIAPGAFEFDFRSATCTFVFQLHLIVPNHAFDQLVPREHPLPSALKFGSFLGSYLWPAPARVHCDDFRSTSPTKEQIFQHKRYGIRTARPWMRP